MTKKNEPISRSKWRLSLLLALLTLASLYFILRGPGRSWFHTIDLPISFYTPSRMWILGGNPYDAGQLLNLFNQSGWSTTEINPSLSAPMTFVILAPLAILPWPVAEKFWTLINIAFTATSLWGLASLPKLSLGKEKMIFFIAYALALAPFHTSFSQGQLTIAVTALVILALRGELAGYEAIAGLMMGLATAFKPQMGLLFMLMYFCRGRWLALAWTVGTVVVLNGLAIGRMWLAGVDWLPTYLGNLADFTRGGTGDPTTANPKNFLMINIQVLLHVFISDRRAVSILSLVLVSLVAIVLLVILRKSLSTQSVLLLYSSFGVLGLLAFYNRPYSATLLVLPLAWALIVWRRYPLLRRQSLLIAVFITPFLMPGPAILHSLTGKSLLGLTIDGWWWRDGILLHQIYALILLTITLVWAARKSAMMEGLGSIPE